ncbi:MAG: peptidylprolyl isomerase [Pseudobacteriovorax sp.]|nr:peptidylprolyl isomerase [Pseudobacteriovorax sp.]
MKKTIALTTILMAGFSGFAQAKEVASFGKVKITEAEFKKAIEGLGPQAEMVKTNPRIQTQFLNHLIDNTLLSDEAKKAKLDKSAQYEKMVQDARRDILARLYVEKYKSEQTSDSKLKAYFDANKKKFSNKEIRASHILLKEDNKAEAEKVLKDALAGKDFAELAKKHSTGPSKDRGGDLNFFGRGRMVPAFEAAAFDTPKGKVHPKLVKTQFGWHIIKVVDMKGSDNAKFADVKSEVKKAVEGNARADVVKSLRDKAKVKVNEDVLKNIKF